MDVIFDRCPLDILGYLITHQNTDMFQIEDWMPRVQESVDTLDMIVFVPIEEPDRVISSHSRFNLRAEVDTVLRDIIVDDTYGLEIDVITISGTLETRIQQVVTYLR